MNESTTAVVGKVAKITLLFWLMKIVATTLGETLGDFLSQTLGWGYTVGIALTLVFFVLVLCVQLAMRTYVPVVYWLVVIGTTTLGTEISDYIDRTLHLGYAAGSLLLVGGLLLSLYLWYRKYGNLAVYPVVERPKELYYWTAILFSNSLGTAFGDFLGDYFGLSYLYGALITGLVIFIVAIAHRFQKVNPIVLFWLAFIFTRPFGATFGDFLTKPISSGGLDLGTLHASLASVGVMAVLLWVAHRKFGR